MLSAHLPPHLALRGCSCGHWIVTCTNRSESYHSFCASHQQNAESVLSSSSSSSAAATLRFRIDYLLPKDWSELLRQCRSLTSSSESFTYSSPGDIATTAEDVNTTLTPGKQPSVLNTAFMHIVKRESNDFVPNNMIYHELQQRYLVSSSSHTTVDKQRLEFSAWLQHHQESGESLVSQQGEKVDTSADPLAHNTRAVEEGEANMRVCSTDFPHTCRETRSDIVEKPIFTFFPHHIIISDCIPHRSKHFVVMVNHKPIVPGHLMVVPIRCVGTIHALSEEEVRDWGLVMHRTLQVLKRLTVNKRKWDDDQNHSKNQGTCCGSLPTLHSEGGFSIAVQQGELAGQTVPHLHTHVIPFDPSGKLAGEPESDEVQERRLPRSGQQMREETAMLKPYFDLVEAAEACREGTPCNAEK